MQSIDFLANITIYIEENKKIRSTFSWLEFNIKTLATYSCGTIRTKYRAIGMIRFLYREMLCYSETYLRTIHALFAYIILNCAQIGFLANKVQIVRALYANRAQIVRCYIIDIHFVNIGIPYFCTIARFFSVFYR